MEVCNYCILFRTEICYFGTFVGGFRKVSMTGVKQLTVGFMSKWMLSNLCLLNEQQDIN